MHFKRLCNARCFQPASTSLEFAKKEKAPDENEAYACGHVRAAYGFHSKNAFILTKRLSALGISLWVGLLMAGIHRELSPFIPK